jgi:hypothetical protein
MGYYLPWAVFSGAVSAIGNGLVSTFGPDTTTAQWIGYQIVLGAGRGPGMQMPLIAVQAVLQPSQIPVAMALLVFANTFGGAIFLTIADSIFSNGLSELLARYLPNVNADKVIAAGGTGVRDAVSVDDLPGALLAYAQSVDRVFYLAAAAAVGCFLISWNMGWKDIRKKTPAAGAV